MSRRGLLVLFGLTLVIVGLLVLDIRISKKKEVREKETKKVLKIAWDNVRVLEIERPEKGWVIRLEKSGEGEKSSWKLVRPVKDDADQDAVDRLWKALQDLEAEESFPIEANVNLSDYHLKKPEAVIRLLGADGRTLGVLQIGSKSPVSGDLYATVPGSGQIYLIAGYRESTLLPEPKDLRNRKLTDFKAVDIARLDIERRVKDPGKLAIEKDGGLWIITTPGRFLADSGKLFSLTSSVEFLEAKDFIAETVDDPASYGLDAPRVKLTVTTKKGSKMTLYLGDEKDDQEVYAMVEGRPRVVTVNKSFLEDMERDLDYWRAPSAVDFDYYNLTQAEITWKGKTWKLERVTEEGETYEEHWYRVEGGKRKEIKFETTDEFFRNIDYGEGLVETDHFDDSMKADYPVDRPWMKLRIKDKEKKWQTVVIFRKEGAGYEWNPDFPKVIYRINEDDWKDIRNAWDPLRKLLVGEKAAAKKGEKQNKQSGKK